jgi:hypothetical protein
VAQTCPIDIARDIERRWQRRSSAAIPLVPRNENDAGTGCCPECNQPASIAPASSEYRDKGIIHHRWLCRACSHEWITVVRADVRAAKESELESS